METTLHRQLKEHYAGDGALVEQRVGRYRIDVVRGRQLVEIQHGSLAAIRDKVRALVKQHDVLVVKPVVARKRLVRRNRRGGKVLSERWSPKRGRVFDLFEELVYFTRVFPHKRLSIEVTLVEVEEWRYPGHGRRRWWSQNDFQVEDQQLLRIVEVERFRKASDLCRLLPATLPSPFDTEQLARALDVSRWIAQRMAYCLRETGAVKVAGKRRNAWLYRAKRAA